MACVQPYAVNPYNFLRWHPCANATLPLSAPLGYCLPARVLCAPLLWPDDNLAYPSLPAVGGDEFNFFINSDVAIDITNGFASVGLGLAQNGKLLVANAGDLFNLPGPLATSFFLYGVLRFDCIPDGTYWPVIYDLADKHILLVANSVKVSNYQNWQRDTVFAKFRHPGTLYGVPYGQLKSFYQTFRLSLSMYQPKITTDAKTYTDRNNHQRTTKLEVGQSYDLQSDFWDTDTYRAAALMLTHKEVFLNDTLLAQGSASLDPEYLDAPFVTAKGKALDQNFARSVLNC